MKQSFITVLVSALFGASAALVSQEEFNCAARTKGGNPDGSYYTQFKASLGNSEITTKREAALYLAHAVWETEGFIYTKEKHCQTNLEACRIDYPNNKGGRPDKVYYGRGMLQLTWDYNYEAASSSLYGDDRLIQNPEQVADNVSIGWATAAWYWKTAVHSVASSFGPTLKAINGAEECDGGRHPENRILRFNNYKEVLKCLSMPPVPDHEGYCHA